MGGAGVISAGVGGERLAERRLEGRHHRAQGPRGRQGLREDRGGRAGAVEAALDTGDAGPGGEYSLRVVLRPGSILN